MTRSGERALLSVVSAAYDVEPSTEAWLQGLCTAAQPVLDDGFGLMGATFKIDNDALSLTSPLVPVGRVPINVAEILTQTVLAAPPAHVRATWGSPFALDTATSAYHRTYPAQRYGDFAEAAPTRQLGILDGIMAKAMDLNGVGCVFMSGLRAERSVSRVQSSRWARVMAHVLAGLRLRSALEAPEAVVDPSGRVVHAEGEAQTRSSREALREAAIRIDRAKHTRALENPHEALEQWRALVAGRWSLVDSFERDGRRYLMARRNDPRLEFPRALSQRHRQIVAYAASGHSNKYIAYALGLAPSTVATHLAAAMLRLGARNRSDLVRLWIPHGD
jgi:DNA-binding CsgD family transcriptional regulator